MPRSVAQKKHDLPITHDELILVVPRKTLFPSELAPQGFLTTPIDQYLAAIQTHKAFHPRSIMEQDPHYKQIIPYMLFKYQERYFLMQRKQKASEQRLKSKYTLGIGGHMRKEDMKQASLFSWAKREFHEEIAYEGTLQCTTLGILNDDSNAVGQVHLGIVLLLQGDSAHIAVKDELQSGHLLTLDAISAYYDQMESWTQLLFHELCGQNTV